MGSIGCSVDMDAQSIQRSKEENQERAFVAASRRKDRSLDARLASANRASMLHKKRTGKALHITKEIVEREAMYEEVDERYQEKRMKLLKAHTSELEAQFHRHLMAAIANNRSRISNNGAVQKMRIDVSAAQSYFPEPSPQSTTASSATADPTSSPSYGYPSPAESYVQTPGSTYYRPTQQQCPSYLSRQQMPYMPQQVDTSSWNSTQQFLALQQSMSSPGQMTSMAQMSPQHRQRVASVPDALLFTQQQQQQYMTPSVPAVSRAQSEPFVPGPLADCQEDRVMPVLTNNSPELSPPLMASTSSQSSSGNIDNQSPLVVQDAYNVGKGAGPGVTEVLESNFDPEYTAFYDFSTTLEDPWQIPVGDSYYEDWVHLDTLPDYELPVAGV